MTLLNSRAFLRMRVLLLWVAAGVAIGTGGQARGQQPVPPPGESESETEERAPVPSALPLPPPPPPPPVLVPRRYGDRGSSEVALGLGYSSRGGFLGAAAFRYFVWDGIAPGIEASYVGGGAGTLRYGMVLGALRLVPLRTERVALVVTGRSGRVYIAEHRDAWTVGGQGGVIIFFGGGNVGLELGYEVLRLLPDESCADLDSCVLQGPVFGLRLTF